LGGYPVALVGSHVANGDRIVASRHSLGELVVYEGDAPIHGLLLPGYVMPGVDEEGETEALRARLL
jgi:hypothetical protein